MELKYDNTQRIIDTMNVLIVPLWNWNNEGESATPGSDCSNRTFMELKFEDVTEDSDNAEF